MDVRGHCRRGEDRVTAQCWPPPPIHFERPMTAMSGFFSMGSGPHWAGQCCLWSLGESVGAGETLQLQAAGRLLLYPSSVHPRSKYTTGQVLSAHPPVQYSCPGYRGPWSTRVFQRLEVTLSLNACPRSHDIRKLIWALSYLDFPLQQGVG